MLWRTAWINGRFTCQDAIGKRDQNLSQSTPRIFTKLTMKVSTKNQGQEQKPLPIFGHAHMSVSLCPSLLPLPLFSFDFIIKNSFHKTTISFLFSFPFICFVFSDFQSCYNITKDVHYFIHAIAIANIVGIRGDWIRRRVFLYMIFQ